MESKMQLLVRILPLNPSRITVLHEISKSFLSFVKILIFLVETITGRGI